MISLAKQQAKTLARLGAEIARIEHRTPMLASPRGAAANIATGLHLPRGRCLSLGIAVIDAILDGGGCGGQSAASALHEVRAPASLDGAAAGGFALALGLRAAANPASIFWIGERETRTEAGAFYGPGMAALGLGSAELIRVFVNKTSDALWAAGEIAAHRGAGLCLLELRGNPARADLTFSRRLALRARESGVPVILLRQGGTSEASAALTRWRVSPAPSNAGPSNADPFNAGPFNAGIAGKKWLGPPAFAVTLDKCRGARTGQWIMEWKTDERLFALAQPANRAFAADRSFGAFKAFESGRSGQVAAHAG